MKNDKVITELSDLQTAIDNKKNDINQLVWRLKDGRNIRLMDMNQQELQKAYFHTTDMLYNENKYMPGKQRIKKNLKLLISDCNAELLLRYILHECDIDILKTGLQIADFIRGGKTSNNLKDDDLVGTLFTNVPKEFETVTLDGLMKACFDKLDVVNRKMLSDNFIISQGIWLTEDEKKELTEFENGKVRPWLEVIKERLFLDNNVKLRVNPNGFSYNEFKCITHLDPISKISSLPSTTLRLLRDKVFPLLDIDTDYHIEKWNTIKSNIERVAEYKGFELKHKDY